MSPNNLKEGSFYWYKSAYGKEWQIFKCIKHYFNESQDQWKAEFKHMTDTCYSNSLGCVERFNQIEIERYIDAIHDVKEAFGSFQAHQIFIEEYNKMYL